MVRGTQVGRFCAASLKCKGLPKVRYVEQPCRKKMVPVIVSPSGDGAVEIPSCQMNNLQRVAVDMRWALRLQHWL